MTRSSIAISKLRFFEPGRNLPNYNSRGKESRFTNLFGKAYFAELTNAATVKTRSHAIAREIPANGYGIADLVSISWTSSSFEQPVSVEEFLRKGRPTIRAFEIKLQDWRKGLLQANRYKFFAHVPIVVIPVDTIQNAARYLDTFRLLGIGLWSFDPTTKIISRYYTPRAKRPADSLQRTKVVSKVNKATKALPVGETY